MVYENKENKKKQKQEGVFDLATWMYNSHERLFFNHSQNGYRLSSWRHCAIVDHELIWLNNVVCLIS